MTTNEIIENVRSSFAMENMSMTLEDEERSKSSNACLAIKIST